MHPVASDPERSRRGVSVTSKRRQDSSIVNNDIFQNEGGIRDRSDAAWGWMFDRYPMLFGMHHPPFRSDGIQSHDSSISRTMCERYCWISALLRDLGAYLRLRRDRDQ